MIRSLAERADAAISHPWALPAYVVGSTALGLILGTNANTLVLSHFANACLILSAIANARRAKKMECEIAALVRVDDRIDEREIEESAATR